MSKIIRFLNKLTILKKNQQVVVSIIIPIYKDWVCLQKCLNSLSLQSFPDYSFEIIVVNNEHNSLPPPEFILPANALIINECKPGSYAARNTGLKYAHGNIVGFTDADCIIDENWIFNAVNLFNTSEKVSRVTGPVDIFRDNIGTWVAWKYDSITAFNQKNNVRLGVAVTANLFVRKDVFEAVGFFNDKLFSGGDIDWNRKVSDAGYSLMYSDDVIVRHPSRKNFNELIHKSRRLAGGGYIKSRQEKKVFMYILRELFPPLNFFKTLIQGGQPIFESFYASLIYWFLKFVRFIEIIRLIFGGKPIR